jgi:hypothetical protein
VRQIGINESLVLYCMCRHFILYQTFPVCREAKRASQATKPVRCGFCTVFPVFFSSRDLRIAHGRVPGVRAFLDFGVRCFFFTWASERPQELSSGCSPVKSGLGRGRRRYLYNAGSAGVVEGT